MNTRMSSPFYPHNWYANCIHIQEETQRASLTADQAQYYFQLVQQHQQQSNNLNQQPTATPAPVAQTQQIQLQGNESSKNYND